MYPRLVTLLLAVFLVLPVLSRPGESPARPGPVAGVSREVATGPWKLPIEAFLDFLASSPLSAQEVQDTRRADVEAILAEAVRYLVATQAEKRGEAKPGLRRASLHDDVAERLSVDTVGLTDAVSRRSGVPVWDGSPETYCDISGYRPYRRFLNPGTADYRIGLGISAISGDSVRVHYSLSSGTTTGGSASRNLLVVQTAQGWSAGEGDGIVIHGTSTPCQPPRPETPEDQIAEAFAHAILHILDNPVEAPPPPTPKTLCIGPNIQNMDTWNPGVLAEIEQKLSAAGQETGEDCMQFGGEPGIQVQTPEGDPAMIFEIRYVLAESPESIDVQFGYFAGDPVGSCKRSFPFACVVECSVSTAEEGWGETSCAIAARSKREPSPSLEP